MASKSKKKSGDDDEQSEEKKSKKKLMVVALLLVVIIAAGGYTMMGKKPKAKAGSTPTTMPEGPVITEPALTVNLTDNHYLEFTPALQLAYGKLAKPLNDSQPRILDLLISQAGSQSEADLTSPGGADRLKAEMVKALNAIWPSTVTDVYFTQFVMQ